MDQWASSIMLCKSIWRFNTRCSLVHMVLCYAYAAMQFCVWWPLKTEASGGDASTVVVVVGQSIFFHRDRISRNKLDFNVDRNSDRNCRYPAAAATVAAATMLLRRNVTRGSLWDSETRTSRRKLIPHDETVTTGIDSRTVVIPGYTYTVFQDYLDTSFGYDGYPLINLKSICSFIKVQHHMSLISLLFLHFIS